MRVCIIDGTSDKFLVRGMSRKTSSSAYSLGMRCVEQDILETFGGVSLPRVPTAEIRRFDYALLPLTSVQEVESFVSETSKQEYRKGNCKIVAGGFGCINIFPIIDDIDAAVFGRCDNKQVVKILGCEYADNVWVKDRDPLLQGTYKIGQFVPPKRVFETGTVGCRRHCSYCQYTNVRVYDNLPYSPEKGAAETDLWASDFSSPRVYVTAIDGLSEVTRFKVNKPIKDGFLVEKIKGAYSDKNRGKVVGIKLYNIVGYPWESEESIEKDYQDLIELLKPIDRRTGKWSIKIMLQNTPFSPEPLTPMEACDVDFGVNFRRCLSAQYKGVDLSVKCTPFLQGQNQRAKRVAINRCDYGNRYLVRDFLNDKVGFQAIDPVIKNNSRPVKYLERMKKYHEFKTT